MHQMIIENLTQLTVSAEAIAKIAKIGDVITLQGDLGAGKTEWARAFIRYFLGQNQQVPSPTFSLVQSYQTPSLNIWHFDLYRIDHSHDVWELGFEEALSDAVSLIEWPEKLEDIVISQHLAIKITIDGFSQRRLVTFNPDSTWQDRLAKII